MFLYAYVLLNSVCSISLHLFFLISYYTLILSLKPLHSLVLPGPVLHDIEKEMYEFYHWDKENRKDLVAKQAEDEERKVWICTGWCPS